MPLFDRRYSFMPLTYMQVRKHGRCMRCRTLQHLACRQICSTSTVLVHVVLLRKFEGSLLCQQIGLDRCPHCQQTVVVPPPPPIFFTVVLVNRYVYYKINLCWRGLIALWVAQSIYVVNFFTDNVANVHKYKNKS